jgi:hypothetical protein
MDYFLPHHVYFCRRGNAAVFLDLHRDDYFLVNGQSATALDMLASQKESGMSTSEMTSALQQLINDGLLTSDSSSGKEIRPVQADLATDDLIDTERALQARLSLLDIARFATACISSAIWLRHRPLESVVGSVASRKARRGFSSTDVERARELTEKFHRLRSYVPRDYLCLYDSLSLIQFLASYGVFPTWVFGVRLEPWAAHCWVQEGSYTFNTEVEEAASYTPVMTI